VNNGISYLSQGKNLIIVIDGKSYTVNKDTHVAYRKIVDAINSKNLDALRGLVDQKNYIINYGKGHIDIKDTTLWDSIYWDGELLNNSMIVRLEQILRNDIPIEPMISFMENLSNNPSEISIQQLYIFLNRNNNIPLTTDGHFLALKQVDSNYFDFETSTIYHEIGKIIEMDRDFIDDDPISKTSSGLHFCSLDFINQYLPTLPNHNIIMIKINPKDVVSVSHAYFSGKGRCCRYKVVSHLPLITLTNILDKVVEDRYL